ncbi:DNA-deoxyinosine glycosylase [Dysgonomonas sp. 216]|uniref:DNA-deoxyinosine glycosylase n=1 Tax=Dysgonomonas sp. 216 TaxID=2302934 RepID=UPI00162377E5|nr:DNA-deoxyinosine glycosylase [Dysgonomonas sp. 216]
MKKAFKPIVDDNSTVLILGTMPGEESLRKQEYYGHKSNQFWQIICSVLGVPFLTDYGAKKQLLLDNRIALWDVLAACEREGSADTAIQKEIPNDFSVLFAAYPNIKFVCFASKKAEEYYIKYVGKFGNKEYFTLPSPSSANARMGIDSKIKDWRIIIDLLYN